jgi:hypothetical protein
MGRNMERILASEARAIPAGGQQAITLRADQGMNVDLGRLCIQVTQAQGGAANASPTAQDGSGFCPITGFLVKGVTQLTRGLSGPPVTVNTGAFSGYRGFTPFRITGKGQYLRMEAGETVAITLANLSAAMGCVASAAAPAILDCDKGIPVAPKTFNANTGAAMLASTVQVAATAANPPGLINSAVVATNLIWQEAGLIDGSQLQISASAQNQFPAAIGINENYLGTFATLIRQIQDVSRSNLVVGTPDVPGNALGVPGSMFFAAAAGGVRHNPWVRLPVQSGTSGNSWIVTTEVYSNDANGMSHASAPFYTGPTSRPPIGCV